VTRRARQLRLGLEILAAYVRVRWCIARYDLRDAVRQLRTTRRAGTIERADHGARLGHAVIRTLSVLPTDSRCLMRSLVLTRLLARRGIESTLVIGVAAGPEFLAHAWVECRGVPLLPAGDGFARLLAV